MISAIKFFGQCELTFIGFLRVLEIQPPRVNASEQANRFGEAAVLRLDFLGKRNGLPGGRFRVVPAFFHHGLLSPLHGVMESFVEAGH